MNRILFEREEIANGLVTFGGVRAEHVLKVLHGEVGQILKTGEVSGPIGAGEIVALDRDASMVTVRVDHRETAPATWVDLLLAPPRPRVFKRLLPQLAALGVGRIVLVGAKKVEKDFWGATILRPENYRPLFVDGLMQSGTTELPELILRRNFRKFIGDELEAAFPDSGRFVAHPYNGQRGRSRGDGARRLLVAIGPEGGWTDEEVELLVAHGFRRHSLGSRILRTDTATVALLAQFMAEWDVAAR